MLAIAPQYQNTDALIRLYNAFIDFLIELADNREIYLSDIITEAISENGERFCKLVGMEKVSTSVHNTKGVYHISMLPPRFTRMNRGYKFEPPLSDLQPLFPYFSRVSSVLLSDSEIKKRSIPKENIEIFYFRTPGVVFPVCFFVVLPMFFGIHTLWCLVSQRDDGIV